MSTPTVTAITFEHHFSGLGVDTPTPRISWAFKSSSSTVRAWVQTAYEVEILFASEDRSYIYRVEGSDSVLVRWPARSLASRESASIRVRVYGKSLDNFTFRDDLPSEWSSSATVEAALLNPAEDFKASFITSSEPFTEDAPLRPIRFRKEFTLPDDVISDAKVKAQARLYITAFGVFEAWVNGQSVSNELFAPGWTSYNHRLAYRIYDVSSLLLPGRKNVICAEVGDGWYAGRIGLRQGESFTYGEDMGIAAQLEVRKRHVRSFTLCTDDTWLSAPSARIYSQLYDGETYDMRQEQEDWTVPGAVPKSGEVFGTRLLPQPTAKLVAINAAPVRVTETVSCKRVFKSKSGKTILDFGQNLVGRLFIPRLQVEPNRVVVFRHAEVMEDDELGVRPLRSAKATDTIIGSGEPIKNWSPTFTFHGFRYAQVNGWPGELSINDIQAQVIHTDMKRRGFFECSNASVNQLHENVVWSTRGNFLSLPTDCPQRDERLGWTGDLQAFTPTATFLYDTLGILESWLQDLAAEQLEEGKGGIPPLVVPKAYMPHWPHIPQAVWDDVTILTPASLYQYSADKALLERQFRSMQTWLDIGIDRAPDGLWNPDLWQLSDWLDPAAPPEDPGCGRTDGVLVANEFLINVTRTFAQLCAVLGKSKLAVKYAEDAARLKALFQRRYISTTGNLMGTTQTGIGLAVQNDLYAEDDVQRATAAAALEKLVRSARFHVATGFAGTPIITHALTTIGKPQLAYRMLLENTCPSWLYAVSMGATTIWERWDSMLPNGHINPGQMTSFNHYAYGSVADWLHSTVGGISPLEPGWRVIRVRPVPGGNLTSAEASFDGPYGLVACQWTWKNCMFRMTLTVPPNCSAVVTIPSELKQSYSLAEHKEKERVLELRALQTTLEHLLSLEPTSASISHINAIRGVALACQIPLREFLDRIGKFEKSLGPFARSKWTDLSAGGRKAQWTMFIGDEVTKLRAIVAAKVLSINLLLGLYTCEVVSNHEISSQQRHSSLMIGIMHQKPIISEI
ncbi:alfa-L-rhamnosidase [Massarina eburnea CBS 473.64]|uniref:alpha-L-rhamnosidase n=1 Tax=Massarina eburnea CBS 473.64 TaxID=1395130 RepID=A0A6A6RWC4_9PLEO|nr:alfa-L-rhamnosidase [Massarina eburnea CBS 473.64]